MDQIEDIGKGRRVVRDFDGTFKHVQLDPEVAREMGSHSKGSKGRDERVKVLLHQAGYDDPTLAPEHLVLLSELASSQRSGSVQALRAFLALTGRGTPDTLTLSPGERCPLCGQVEGGRSLLDMPGDMLVSLMDRIRVIREESEANKAAGLELRWVPKVTEREDAHTENHVQHGDLSDN